MSSSATALSPLAWRRGATPTTTVPLPAAAPQVSTAWRARLHLLLLLTLTALAISPCPSQARRVPTILRSKDTGVTHCALEGELGAERVTLHIWVRMAQGLINTSLMVKGFAMLQAPESVPTPASGALFLRHAHAYTSLSDVWYLRSPYSNKTYNLTVDMPGRIKQSLGTSIREPITFKANISLSGGDTGSMDYELRVTGFKWFCMVMGKPSAFARQGAHSITPSTATSSASSRDPLAAALQEAAALAPALNQSSLGPATQVWQLLASYHKLTPTHFASVLWHHYSWHRHMGVHAYILYVYKAVVPLLEEPLIKALISAGRLQLVLFDDLGLHEVALYQPHIVDHYLFQIVILNHMLLAMWNTDSLVVFSDLDEYLLTPQPMTVVQMYKEAVNGTVPLAGIRVSRAETRCKADASLLQCNPKRPYAHVWAAYHPLDVEAGKVLHPFVYQEITNTTVNPTHFTVFPKLIVDPNLARVMVVHGVWPMNHATVVNASSDRAVMAHLFNLFVVRGVSQAPTWAAAPGDNWLWPADHLCNQTHTSHSVVP